MIDGKVFKLIESNFREIVMKRILKSIFGKSTWGKKYERIYPKGYVKDKKRYKQIEKRLYGNRI